jgi:hypothetical protein
MPQIEYAESVATPLSADKAQRNTLQRFFKRDAKKNQGEMWCDLPDRHSVEAAADKHHEE